MERNSTTLYLESPGSITPVPWVNNAPVFDNFTDPTLSVLQKAWANFVASGQQLEVISDSEPSIPEVRPDWQGFMNGVDLPSEGGNGLYDELQIDKRWAIHPISGEELAKTVGSQADAVFDFCKDALAQEPNSLDIRNLTYVIYSVWPLLNESQQIRLRESITDNNIPVSLPT